MSQDHSTVDGGDRVSAANSLEAVKQEQGAASSPATQFRVDSIRKFLQPIAFVVFCGSQILDILNLTGVTFALPSVVEKFGTSDATSTWVLSAYSLTFGCFILPLGRLGDVIGHKRIFVTGMLAFAVFSALSAGVDNLIAIIIFRAFQGIAAAATVPTSYALVAITYEGKAQSTAMGAIGSAQAVGGVIGTILGGVFAQTVLGYKALFWLSFGLAIIFFILAILTIPPSPPMKTDVFKKLDIYGTLFVVIGALLIVFAFTSAPGNWSTAKVIAPMIIGVLLLCGFLIWEEYFSFRFNLESLIPREVWTYPNFLPVFIIAPLTFPGFFIIILNGSLLLTQSQGHSFIIAAVYFLPICICCGIFATVGGALYGKFPPKYALIGGPVSMIVGYILFSRNGLDTIFWKFTFTGELFIGTGIAFVFANLINVAVSSAPGHMQGVIAGIIQTSGQIGTAIGFGIATSMVSGSTPESKLVGYQNSFYLAIAFNAVAALVALVFVRVNPKAVEAQPAEKLVSAENPTEPTPSAVDTPQENTSATVA